MFFIRLTKEEHQYLMMLHGYAMGAADAKGDTRLQEKFLGILPAIINAEEVPDVNRGDDPNYSG